MLKSFKTNYLPIVLFFLIVLLTFLAYFRSLHAPLIFDDFIYITAWKLKSILHHLSLSVRSVANLSFALNYNLSGMNLVAFRITNIIFHILSAVSAFYLTYMTLTLPSMRDKYISLDDRRTPLYISLFVATLFLLHPIQTSAVNYITQRMAIMACMFSFAGIILYVRGALHTGKNSIYYYAASVLFFVLAIFSKENAVMVLPMLMIYDFVFISSFRWSEFRRRFIPIAVLVVILSLAVGYYLKAGGFIIKIMTILSNPYQPMASYGWSGTHMHWTPVENVLTEFRVVLRYIFLILVPLPSYMVFDYSNAYPVSKGLFHPITTLLSLVSLGFIVFFSLRYFKKIPLISFGIIWYLITISLESFIALGLDPYFEYRNYLPSYGLFLALASLFVYTDKSRGRVKKEVIILLVALLLFVMTFTRNGVWREGRLLWEDTLEKSPNNVRARVNLGVVYSERGWIDKAIEQYQVALKLMPDSTEALGNLGIAYAKKGWLDKAIEEYRAALKLRPDYYDAYYNMGLVFFEKGEIDKAIEAYQTALKINPELAKAHVNLGIAFGTKNLLDKAIKHFRTAIELEPEFAEAHYNLGFAYGKLGSVDKAIDHLKIALKTNPEYEKARLVLAQLFFSKGFIDQSVEQYQIALKLKPDNADAHYQLANIFYKNKRIDQAIEHYQLTVKLKSDFIDAHYNLGVAFLHKGSMDKAIEQYQIVIKLNPNYAEAHENIGITYANKGLTDKAIEHFKIATTLNPQNQTFRDNLAKAYQMRNSRERTKTTPRR